MIRPRCAIVFLLPALAACSASGGQTVASVSSPEPCMQTGTASWYRPNGARPAASGETPRSGALVAAHQTLAIGTDVMVTELASGRSVVVRVIDRGPFTKGRIIDLSSAAAAQLGMRQDGVAQVRLEIYQPPSEATGVNPAAMADAKCPFREDTAARAGPPI